MGCASLVFVRFHLDDYLEASMWFSEVFWNSSTKQPAAEDTLRVFGSSGEQTLEQQKHLSTVRAGEGELQSRNEKEIFWTRVVRSCTKSLSSL